MTTNRSNDLRIDFLGGQSNKLDFYRKIRSIQMDSQFGKASKLVCSIALHSYEIKNLHLEQLPSKLKLEWHNRLFFEGEATSFDLTAPMCLNITFEDIVHRFNHIYTETQTKQQKLRGFIEQLFRDLNPKPKLTLKNLELFDENLPTFSLGHRTIQDVLDELAQFYGFNYFLRCSNNESTLCFLSAGSAVNPKPTRIAMKNIIENFPIHHSLRYSYETVNVILAEATSENKKRILRQDSLRKPLQLFESGQTMKNKFELKLPQLDLPLVHPDLYSRAERILPYQHAKTNQEFDSITFTIAQPQAQIGDSIQLEDPFSKYQNQAVFLVKATSLVIKNSVPLLHISAVRP